MSAPEFDLITISSLTAAFAAAASGSLHCIVMCGPLRLISGETKMARLAYQAGRGGGYILLGSFAGKMGAVLPFWALVTLVITGLIALVFNLNLVPQWSAFRSKILTFASASPLLIGISSALLPCGLLHGWVLSAAATANPIHGALLLGILWVGTMPALEIGSRIAHRPIQRLKLRFPRALSLSLIALALLPISNRGFKIMFSPKQETAATSCHGSPSSTSPEPGSASRVPERHHHEE